jgi:RimJ/RimL family protein N-acetyltransferase
VQEDFSRRLAKVCGRWKDHERWAILAEDFPYEKVK